LAQAGLTLVLHERFTLHDDAEDHVMMSTHRRHSGARPPRSRTITATLALVLCAALLAACGSSSSSSSSCSSDGTSGGSGGGSGTVAVAKVAGYGSVLVTATDQPVYILSTDPSGSSKCNGACAKIWKPVTASGSPSAGSGADSSLVSSFMRKDGTTQVLYDKHALYTHTGSPASVAGTASEGGVWYLINAKGAAVKSTQHGGY
jgi:predicted lipoprotein with Yx(FWY)xxD motif